MSARIRGIAAKRRVGDYLRVDGVDPDETPSLTWHFEAAALAAEAANLSAITPTGSARPDGWYCPLTKQAATAPDRPAKKPAPALAFRPAP